MNFENLITRFRKFDLYKFPALLFAILISAIVLAIDLSIPLGVAGGVPYVVAILLTLWSSRKVTLGIAVLVSFLTIVGFYFSPSGGVLWQVLANRFLALFAIWVTVVGINFRRKTEAKLHQSAQRNALHLEQSPLAFIEWNRNFEVTAWNKAATTIFGYSEKQAMGRHGKDLIVPADVVPKVDEIWQALLAGSGGSYSLNENITKDGRRITCEWFNTQLSDENGQVIGVASLAMDITDRILAESELQTANDELENRVKERTQELADSNKALRTSERNYRNLVESSGICVANSTVGGEILYVNEAILKIFGYDSIEEIKTVDALTRYKHPETRQQFIKQLQESGSVNNLEAILLTKTGEERVFLMGASLDEDLISVALVDITERKRVEEALRASEENFRNIFHSTPESLLTVDKELNVVKSNKKYGKLIHLYAPRLNMSEDALRTKILSELKKRIGKEKQGLIEIDSVTNS